MEQQLNLNSEKSYKGRIVFAVLSLATFCFIAWNVVYQQTGKFDTAVDYFAYGMRNPVTEAILIPITYMGNWQFIVAIAAVLIALPKTRTSIGIPMGVTTLVSVALFKILKPLFGRPRPDESLRLITEGGWSFPSGHSMNGLVCYGVLIFLIRRSCNNKTLANLLTLLLTILILLIGWSRIFVGVHYVSDVLGGWCIGLSVLMVATIIIDKTRRN